MPVISVLWGLGLLTAVALSLLWNGTMAYSLTHNDLESAEITAALEAGVNRAVAGLLDARPDQRWRADGVPQSFEFGGVYLKVSIEDELGKIDLNQADVALMVSLLQSAGLVLRSAGDLADKIADWRTATPLKHLNGAKDQDYRMAGITYRPRNGPFQSVAELLLVMDMTPVLFRRIEPALTVYSGHQFVDARVAPREVLRALPGLTPDSVEAQLDARTRQLPPADRSAGDGLSSLRGRAFTIRIAFEKSNKTIKQEAAIRLTEDLDQPYWLLSWRRL